MDNQSSNRKILLSTVGTRGDVQPLVAIAKELREIGFQPILCVGPNFKDFVSDYGFDFVPYGLDLTTQDDMSVGLEANEEKLKWVQSYIDDVMQTTLAAAKDCEMIIAVGVFQYVAHSVAQLLGIPYRCGAFCPSVIPSASFPPPRFIGGFNSQVRPKSINKSLWLAYQKSLDSFYLDTLNRERANLGLASINNVHRHILSTEPWLLTDKVLSPAVRSRGYNVLQTGAWILADDTPLPDEVEAFIQAGQPPVYIGFGSMRDGNISGQDISDACRAVGCRAIIYRGWGDLEIQENDHILSIGNVNHSKLFPLVAGVVHHGGAGTTTTAAIAGTPQLLVPHFYDQFYWAKRVKQLGIGLSCRDAYTLSVDALAGALRDLLQPQRKASAQDIAKQMDINGAKYAAQLVQDILS